MRYCVFVCLFLFAPFQGLLLHKINQPALTHHTYIIFYTSWGLMIKSMHSVLYILRRRAVLKRCQDGAAPWHRDMGISYVCWASGVEALRVMQSDCDSEHLGLSRRARLGVSGVVACQLQIEDCCLEHQNVNQFDLLFQESTVHAELGLLSPSTESTDCRCRIAPGRCRRPCRFRARGSGGRALIALAR